MADTLTREQLIEQIDLVAEGAICGGIHALARAAAKLLLDDGPKVAACEVLNGDDPVHTVPMKAADGTTRKYMALIRQVWGESYDGPGETAEAAILAAAAKLPDPDDG